MAVRRGNEIGYLDPETFEWITTGYAEDKGEAVSSEARQAMSEQELEERRIAEITELVAEELEHQRDRLRQGYPWGCYKAMLSHARFLLSVVAALKTGIQVRDEAIRLLGEGEPNVDFHAFGVEHTYVPTEHLRQLRRALLEEKP